MPVPSLTEALREGRVLPLLILAGLILRLGAVIPVHSQGQSSEEKVFIALGHSILDRHEFIDPEGGKSIRAPLYPALLATCFAVAGKGLTLPIIVNVLLGVIAIALGYQVCMYLWRDKRIAHGAAAAIALYPGLIIYGALLQSECLYIVLFLLVLLALYRLREGAGMGMAVLLGISAGLAALTRAVILGFFPLLLGCIWLIRYSRDLPQWRVVLVAVVAFVLTVAPWTYRNYLVHGAFVPVATVTGGAMLVGNNPFVHGTPAVPPEYDQWVRDQAWDRGVDDFDTLSEVGKSRVMTEIAVEYITANPRHALRLAGEKLFVLVLYPIAHSAGDLRVQALAVFADIVFGCVVLVGLIGSRKNWIRLLPVYLLVLYTAGVHMVMHAEARYRLPVVAVVALLFGYGLVLVRDRKLMRERMRPTRAKVALIALCACFLAAYGYTGWLYLHGQF